MTLSEAKYVLSHKECYDQRTVTYAQYIVDDYYSRNPYEHIK